MKTITWVKPILDSETGELVCSLNIETTWYEYLSGTLGNAVNKLYWHGYKLGIGLVIDGE